MEFTNKWLEFFIPNQGAYLFFVYATAIIALLLALVFLWFLVKAVIFLFKGNDFREKRKNAFTRSGFSLLLLLIFLYTFGKISLYGIFAGFA